MAIKQEHKSPVAAIRGHKGKADNAGPSKAVKKEVVKMELANGADMKKERVKKEFDMPGQTKETPPEVSFRLVCCMSIKRLSFHSFVTFEVIRS